MRDLLIEEKSNIDKRFTHVTVESINKVQEVAGEDVPPTANPVPLEAYLRPDEPATPLTQEEALSGAPRSESGMFVAPRILGEE